MQARGRGEIQPPGLEKKEGPNMKKPQCCELCDIQEGILVKIEAEFVPFIPEVSKVGIPKAINGMGGLIYICGTCHMELLARKQIQKNDKAILINEINTDLLQ